MIDQASFSLDVSRETFDDLVEFQNLLLQWTKTINLIAPSTKADCWNRHVLDSAQLFPFIPASASHLVDLGSGGGLPALVLAIMAKESRPDLRFTLIESDQRKAVFLRTVSQQLKLAVTVKAVRLEDADVPKADVVTARALAPLVRLLEFADQLMQPEGTAIFQKGQAFNQELDTARERWHFDATAHVSRTNPDARILEIKDIRRVQ
ncbi:MAG: 16S rRNA (guanine(527)-N(7))-methyltransferase RsmG [Alphaproteobacteria bacterium]|nr:16S rRNA (guanine(527)-N(7))-methyltransferase RsmG [Alphaproteobacteria bacterium]